MHEYLRDLHTRYQVIFSTDVVRFLGNLKHAVNFFETACDGNLKFGLEVIAFLHTQSSLNPLFLDNNSNEHIAGLHGKVGKNTSISLFEYLTMSFINSQLTDTIQLLKIARSFNRPTYVNVHEKEIKLLSQKGQLTNLDQFNPAILLTENDTCPESLKQAKILSSKHQIGKIFDIFHATIPHNDFNWATDWQFIIQEIRDYQPTLIHIPVGINNKDSLPSNIPIEFWQALARVMTEFNTFPVIECQWGYTKGALACKPGKDPWRIRHIQEKLKTLISAGVITPAQTRN